MSRIGNFSEIDTDAPRADHELIKQSAPAEIDKEKLEHITDNNEKRTINKPEQYLDDGKNKLSRLDLSNHIPEKEKLEKIEPTVQEYFDDLKKRSDCPNTIQEKPFEANDLKKLSPEETAARREEFVDNKSDLKKQWESENGQPWPKYDQDVYSSNGHLIRKAGGYYDAHHIQPLGMNGKNEAANITPLHANEHYDKQGIHAPDSPYSKLDKML